MSGPPQASQPTAASASPLATASASRQGEVGGRQKPQQRETLKEPNTQGEEKRKKHRERHEEWTHCVDGHRYTLDETRGGIVGGHGCGPAKCAISAQPRPSARAHNFRPVRPLSGRSKGNNPCFETNTSARDAKSHHGPAYDPGQLTRPAVASLSDRSAACSSKCLKSSHMSSSTQSSTPASIRRACVLSNTVKQQIPRQQNRGTRKMGVMHAWFAYYCHV